MSSNHNNCAVAPCKNTGRNNSEVIYHTFPKDKQIQNEWIARCKRKDKINVRNARVCSAHFLPEDYERDLKNELLGLPLKKLRTGAIPSQHIWQKDDRTEQVNYIKKCKYLNSFGVVQVFRQGGRKLKFCLFLLTMGGSQSNAYVRQKIMSFSDIC